MIEAAEGLVKAHMQKYDPSHDWYHGESGLVSSGSVR